MYSFYYCFPASDLFGAPEAWDAGHSIALEIGRDAF
jgi:hypothetical protein